MKRGNNYSGARFLFSTKREPQKGGKPSTPGSGGLTMSGGSNRPTAIRKDSADNATKGGGGADDDD